MAGIVVCCGSGIGGVQLDQDDGSETCRRQCGNGKYGDGAKYPDPTSAGKGYLCAIQTPHGNDGNTAGNNGDDDAGNIRQKSSVAGEKPRHIDNVVVIAGNGDVLLPLANKDGGNEQGSAAGKGGDDAAGAGNGQSAPAGSRMPPPPPAQRGDDRAAAADDDRRQDDSADCAAVGSSRYRCCASADGNGRPEAARYGDSKHRQGHTTSYRSSASTRWTKS